MSEKTLLSIGQFAKLAGLTVHTLRHYDAVGLLAPADVDPETGYRRYDRSQLPAARLISDLRWLDLPLHLVRAVIADPDSPEARQVLAAHADQLVRSQVQLDRQIAQSTRYASEGVPMPTTVTGTAPVQIKLAVADRDRARAFYAAAFGLSEGVIRRTDDADFTGYQFGTYGQPGFFLLVLSEPEAFDNPGRGTIGFTVEDLDEAHRRALGAGATEAVPISSPQGMPRNSAVTDPDGNWLWLYQG